MNTKTRNLLENYKLEGSNLPILTIPNEILRKYSSKVLLFDDELILLAKNMIYTMYNAPGIGLAAPQVGYNIRMFVVDVRYFLFENKLHNLNPMVLINPEIVKTTGECRYDEGCLSIPNTYNEVTRPESIEVKYQDLDGQYHILTANGLLSRCIQHENDHLNGVLFIDKI